EVDTDNETEDKSDTEENDTSGSDSKDLYYHPKHDVVFDDDEHILEDVLVSMNNFNFNPNSKHDLSIVVVEVHEHDLNVIDYDSFSSDLDDGIDFERITQLRGLRRIGKIGDHVIKTLATNPNIHVRAVQDQMQKQFDVGISKMKAFRKWELTRIPCKHVVTAIYNISENGMGVVVESITVIIPPIHKPQIGRPPKKRKKSVNELASQSCSLGKLSRKGKPVKCRARLAAGARNVSSQAAGSSQHSQGLRQGAGARNASSKAVGYSQPSAAPSQASQ
ncbi:hypothetical protein Tco_0002390, partial [Tanacetum coccineum]